MKLWRFLFTFALIAVAAASASAQSVTRSLTVGQTAIGHLRLDGPGVETWSFEGEAGRVVSVTAGSDIFEPTLQLVSPIGAELGRDDEGRNERCCDRMRVVALLPADGRYLVRVATDGRGRGGAYELTVHAPTVTPLELNTPADGRYDDAQGADVWSFRGEAGQIVRFTAGDVVDDFVPDLRLTSPNGERVGRDSGSVVWPLAGQLVAVLPVDGRYLVEVSDAFLYGSGTYRLTAETVTPVPLGEIEPGGGVLREDAPTGDVWSFEAAAEQLVEVDVVATRDVFRWSYHLISPTGNVVGGGSRPRVFPVLVDGRYLVSLDLEPEGEVHEVSVRPVSAVPLGDGPGAGVLGDGNDTDVWGFDGVAGQVVGVEVAGPGASLLAREIISPTGESLPGWWLPSPGRVEDSLRMEAALPVDGRYLVRLSRGAVEPVPYELAVRVLRATSLLEWDRPVAGLFSGDGPRTGMWEFDGAAGQAANVGASCDFRCRLQLVLPSGEAVESSQWTSRPELTELLAVSGRYRVLLAADDAAVGAYEIRVGSTAVTPRPLELDAAAAGVHEGRPDHWSFEGVGGRVVNVSATASDALMGFDVMSPVGEIVARTDSPRRDHALTRLPVDGVYVIRVWPSYRDVSVAYAVAVWSVAPPTPLGMGTPAAGTLDYHGSELGFWAFESTVAGSVRVSVVADGFEPLIQLSSPTGDLVSGREGGADGHGWLEAFLPVPGRYVVRVRSLYGRSGFGEGEYEVTVEPVAGSPR